MWVITMTLIFQSIMFALWNNGSNNGKEVPCYDAYYNKIVGQTCITTNSEDNTIEIIIGSFLLEMVIIFGGYFLYRDDEEDY